MANEASWSWSAVMGVTINGPCWTSVYAQGSGDFTHTCGDENETTPCTAVVRFLNGSKVKYTFTCTAIPENKGSIVRQGADLFIHKFDAEEWS